mgnify:CR=1 FL=1
MANVDSTVRTPTRIRFAWDEFGGAAEYQVELTENPTPTVATPTAVAPASGTNYEGAEIMLEGSPYDGTWGQKHVDTRFRLYQSSDGTLLETYENLGPVTQKMVSAAADMQPYQAAPHVLTPRPGTIKPDTATVTATSYRVAHAQADTHNKTQWQVFDSGADPETATPRIDYETTTDLEGMEIQNQFGQMQVRLRQHGINRGWGPWSPMGPSFEVVDPAPNTPTAEAPTGGADSWPVHPTLFASAHTSNVDEAKVASRYKLRDATDGTVIYDSGEIEYTTTHAVPVTALPANYRG